MSRPVFRFAPSPNGYLHLGHALSALLNFDLACATGGRFLLRIEDIDETRCRPEYEMAIYEDLAWLGIVWETPVRRQSAHLETYRTALARLQERGFVYPAFESRGELARIIAAAETAGTPWRRDPDGAPVYPGRREGMVPAARHARHERGDAHVLRLDVARASLAAGPLTWREAGAGPDGEHGAIAADPQAWGDVVLARRDTPTSYHLSVVLDDAEQGVTEVVRGADLFWATSVHRLLQRLLGLPEPGYRHHRLIRDSAGRKLSKSTRSTALRALRAAGATPQDIRRCSRAEPGAAAFFARRSGSARPFVNQLGLF